MSLTATRNGLLDSLSALSEPTRARTLLTLERQELTVSELCAVLQAPQSTVSRHLKSLAETGWVESRPEGTSRFYRVDREAMAPPMQRLWLAVRDELAASPGAEQDRARLACVLAERRTRSAEFFQSEAGSWDRTRDELFGSGFYLQALPGLLDPRWTVGELGCGTAPVSEALAPFVARVIAVDDSEAMLDEARRRLAAHGNVEVVKGSLEALPIDDATLDAAVLTLVLHHLPDPVQALVEVARALRPGGRLLVVDMLPHENEDLAGRMGHVWLGFSTDTIARLLDEAGFEAVRPAPMPADTAARGPALFAATARRPSISGG